MSVNVHCSCVWVKTKGTHQQLKFNKDEFYAYLTPASQLMPLACPKYSFIRKTTTIYWIVCIILPWKSSRAYIKSYHHKTHESELMARKSTAVTGLLFSPTQKKKNNICSKIKIYIHACKLFSGQILQPPPLWHSFTPAVISAVERSLATIHRIQK